MTINDLVAKFSATTEMRQKAIFNTLFIATNKLQTLFDHRIPVVSLKQFILLSTVRQAAEPLTFTQLGELLGCSRQNIKKLADALVKKGLISLQPSPSDARAVCITPTEQADGFFQNIFPVYQEELKYLFEVYSQDEIDTLFSLLNRLFAGIDRLERRTAADISNKGAPRK